MAVTMVPSMLNSITACARLDRGDLAGVFHALDLLRGDVGGELDDPDRLAVCVEDRIVGGMDPDFAAALAEAPVLRGLELAAVQAGPEFAIGRALALGRVDEHAVMLALDLVERVAQRVQEILVRCDDGAVELELDHRLGFADGLDLRERALNFRLMMQIEHAGLRAGFRKWNERGNLQFDWARVKVA